MLIFITEYMTHPAACQYAHLPSNKSGKFFGHAGIAEFVEHVLDLPSLFHFLSRYLHEQPHRLTRICTFGQEQLRAVCTCASLNAHNSLSHLNIFPVSYLPTKCYRRGRHQTFDLLIAEKQNNYAASSVPVTNSVKTGVNEASTRLRRRKAYTSSSHILVIFTGARRKGRSGKLTLWLIKKKHSASIIIYYRDVTPSRTFDITGFYYNIDKKNPIALNDLPKTSLIPLSARLTCRCLETGQKRGI